MTEHRALHYWGLLNVGLFIAFLAGLQATPGACPKHYGWLTNVLGFGWIISSILLSLIVVKFGSRE